MASLQAFLAIGDGGAQRRVRDDVWWAEEVRNSVYRKERCRVERRSADSQEKDTKRGRGALVWWSCERVTSELGVWKWYEASLDGYKHSPGTPTEPPMEPNATRLAGAEVADA